MYLGFGFAFFQEAFGYLQGVEPSIVWLAAVSAVFSLAVQGWNSFVFVSKRIKGFRFVISNIFKIETAVSAAISVAVAEILVLAWIIYFESQVLFDCKFWSLAVDFQRVSDRFGQRSGPWLLVDVHDPVFSDIQGSVDPRGCCVHVYWLQHFSFCCASGRVSLCFDYGDCDVMVLSDVLNGRRD